MDSEYSENAVVFDADCDVEFRLISDRHHFIKLGLTLF
jgi:hypothetical protein